MTAAMKMAGHMAYELRWAELNEYWQYMEALMGLLETMGARVMRLEDPNYKWRAHYIVSFTKADALPGVI